MVEAVFIIATFTAPENITTNPQSMLWFLPLAAAIALVYKTTKLPKITAAVFLKEVTLLFGSIVSFIIVAALALYLMAWLITE